MKRPIRKLICIAAAVIMTISSSACGASKIDPVEPETNTTSATEAVTEAVTEAPEEQPTGAETAVTKKKTKKKKAAKKENYNQLTGLYDVSNEGKGKRPCAVMVNNIEAALPQYGIYDADVLFEIVAEGGITRLMAVYGDEADIPNVCSVRSARF